MEAREKPEEKNVAVSGNENSGNIQSSDGGIFPDNDGKGKRRSSRIEIAADDNVGTSDAAPESNVGSRGKKGRVEDGTAPGKTGRGERFLKEMASKKLAELTEAFLLFDFDRDGIISFSDIKKVFVSLDKGDTDDEQIRQMLAEGLNPLDFRAFVKLMGCKTLEMDDEEILIRALSQWDYGTGLIPEEKIKHDLMTWGDRFTEEEAAAALEYAPVILTENKEKMIDYVQFSNDVCGFCMIKNFFKRK